MASKVLDQRRTELTKRVADVTEYNPACKSIDLRSPADSPDVKARRIGAGDGKNAQALGKQCSIRCMTSFLDVVIDTPVSH
jgi:hypothetical protein